MSRKQTSRKESDRSQNNQDDCDTQWLSLIISAFLTERSFSQHLKLLLKFNLPRGCPENRRPEKSQAYLKIITLILRRYG